MLLGRHSGRGVASLRRLATLLVLAPRKVEGQRRLDHLVARAVPTATSSYDGREKGGTRAERQGEGGAALRQGGVGWFGMLGS